MTIWRILNVLAVCALVAAAVVVYRIKYQATWQAEEVVRLQSTIGREKANIALLQAVLAHLERPDRIELLAAKYLDLKPFDVHQRESIGQLPMRPPEVDLIGKTIASLDLDAPIKAVPHDDPIARTIESLGLAGPTRDRSIERSLKALGMTKKAAQP
ncbi:MAG TPA: hypothetical protein VHD15_00060 [Hyphomicrobiales bacterium]|nr:hypothetical protein [Hyphomicrobiales bacterium]